MITVIVRMHNGPPIRYERDSLDDVAELIAPFAALVELVERIEIIPGRPS